MFFPQVALVGVPWTIIWKSSACWLCLRERAKPWVLFVVSLYCSNSPATSLPTIALATCICLQPCLPAPKESHLDSGESQGPDPLCHPGGPSAHCLEGSTLSTTILGSILDISLHSASVHHLLLRNSSSWTQRQSDVAESEPVLFPWVSLTRDLRQGYCPSPSPWLP